MAEFRLIPNDLPLEPEHLGESLVTVEMNSNRVITVDDIIKSSFPPYYQEQGFLIGDIKIIGYGNNKNSMLYQPDLASLYNLYPQGQIYFDTNTNQYVNNEVLAQTIKNGDFQVRGFDASLPADYVVFIAKAINPSTGQQSNYSTVKGKLWIKVVSSNNQPPSKVGDGYERFNLGVPKVFSVDMFTTKTTPPYSDPENDAAFSLKIIALPTIGKLTNRGVDCNVGDIVLMSEISLGLFKYHDLGNANLSSVVTFQYQINDVGSKIFVG
ncbi:MAG: hypothetical protein LBE34_12595 [Flavobacteriaceae bacterium]|jgi:hypothetical protein|nr:hypothetical protein [Flavobacteriaceae bacterium]